MQRQKLLGICVAAAGALSAAGCGNNSATDAGETKKIVELQTRLMQAENAVARAQDVSDINRLQRAYGYYLDKGLADDLGDLFTHDATAQYSKSGLLIGQDGIRRGMHFLGPDNTLIEGRLNNHMQLQGVVHVAPEGNTAKGRWRIIAITGNFGERASWGEGPYEVEYAKDNGVWKISKLVWYAVVSGALYDGGWTKKREPVPRKPGSIPPGDAPSSIPDLKVYPDVYMPPYHYKNPVTGQ